MAGPLSGFDDDGFGPAEMLECYARGVFPMADDREDSGLRIISPRMRAILPLDRFHIPRRLKRTVRQDGFDIRVNSQFEAMVALCAETDQPERDDTWISRRLQSLYATLHRSGFAHSIECWRGGELVGGLFGVTLNGAFFGESMASRARDASKVALVHLVARLRLSGFGLLDCQFQTEHLSQFGTEILPREVYLQALSAALSLPARFDSATQLNGARALSLAAH